MSRVLTGQVRLRGLRVALHFARLPVVCAGLIALTSEPPRGRVIAAAIALVVSGLGMVIHARQLVLGRAD